MPGDLTALTLDRRRLPRHRARLLGRDLRADLPRRLGRPARAAGPAHPALRAPAALSIGFYSRRRAGVLISRLTNDVEALDHARLRRRRDAVRLLADADRHGGDPVLARRPARAADLPRLPDARARLARVPDRLRRRLPAHAREGRARSPPTCRRRCRASASCARSRRSRATCDRFAELNEENRDANMKTVNLNAAYFPAVELLSGAGDRRDPALRRHAGDRRRHHDRRARRVHRRAEQLLRPDPAALPALHDLPVGHGGARQDLRAARRGARPGRRAGRHRPAAAARRDRASTTSPSRYGAGTTRTR